MKPKLNINESFICKIWEGGEAYYSGLQNTSGEDIEIMDHGERNYDSGPDYKNAKVKIDGRVFTGDVEIHREFRNWEEHSHHKDRKYNSVILHVVLWDSEERIDPRLRIKRAVPTVILSHFLNDSIHNIWQDVISKPSDKLRLACYGKSKDVNKVMVNEWLKHLSIERLNLKTERLKLRLDEISSVTGTGLSNKDPWEQLLYEFTFEALGFSKNKEQMLKLSSNLPLKMINKVMQKNGSLTLLQALLYGSAGFLFDVRIKDEYIDIIKEYWKEMDSSITSVKMNRHEWNFFRMRPQNFPTIRLAYGSQFILSLLYKDLFRKIISAFNNSEVKDVHSSLSVLLSADKDSYWNEHYDLGKKSAASNQLIGKQRINDIIVNVIIPLVSLYASEFKDNKLTVSVSDFYNTVKINADNSVVNIIDMQVLSPHGIKTNSPAAEQAAVQLYNFYCMRERCSECEIGKSVFNDKGYEYKIIFY